MDRLESGDRHLSRRDVMAGGAAAAGALLLGGNMNMAQESAQPQAQGPAITNGRINQSVSRWCYGKLSIEQLAVAAKQIGLKGHRPGGP